jgi:hypothetical protein
MAFDTIPPPNLPLIGGAVTEIARDLRLLRLQVDAFAARLATHDQRFTPDLIGEVARGFGQQQEQLTRIEQRFDAVDAGLTAIRTTLAEMVRAVRP